MAANFSRDIDRAVKSGLMRESVPRCTRLALVRALLLTVLAIDFGLVLQGQMKVPCYSGDTYRSCTPAERAAKAKLLARAKSASVVIDATPGVACGDGSGTCIRVDSDAVAMIQRAVDASELWQSLTRADSTKADIILTFKTRDRESLQLCAYDADSNGLLYCEYRNPSIALDNDSSREIAHFLNARRDSQK